MKHIHSQVAVILSALFITASSLFGETPNERDYKQLRANRDKAAAVALEPINRRYRDDLEKLFKKATQAAELDLAREIQGELQAAGGAAAAKTAGANPAVAAAPSAPADKTDLRKLIENSEWKEWQKSKEEGDPKGRLVFHKDGRVSWTGGHPINFYVIQAPDIVKLSEHDLKKDRKGTFFIMHVDMAEKTATKDVSLSTRGGDIFLKYDGPAKAMK